MLYQYHLFTDSAFSSSWNAIMIFLVDCLYSLVAVLIAPIILYRMVRHQRYCSGWSQRLGRITRKNPGKKCIWLHAVSVGEVNAARTIVKELETKFPDIEIVISTTTDTGFTRASNLFSDKFQVFFFPLDFSWIMLTAFRNIRPTLCLLMELEVWPNFVQIAQKFNSPIVVVNGRISDKSFNIYKMIKPIGAKFFQKLTLILAQTDQYAERFKQIGCPDEKIIVTGSLKYDTAQITDKDDGADQLATQLKIKKDGILWVAGATGNDEEQIILSVYCELKQDDRFRNLRLAIVPRKPERFDNVAVLIQQIDLPLIRLSHLKNGSIPQETDSQAVILGDTMGDLRKFYSLATIIFVGRSLVPMGGSDMAEAAALGKCTVFGPHAFNFRHTVDALLADEGAILVKDKNDLLKTMQKCLTKPDFAKKIAQAGQNVIKKNQGATEKSIEQIAKFLNG